MTKKLIFGMRLGVFFKRLLPWEPLSASVAGKTPVPFISKVLVEMVHQVGVSTETDRAGRACLNVVGAVSPAVVGLVASF